jgi:hypothetical protein
LPSDGATAAELEKPLKESENSIEIVRLSLALQQKAASSCPFTTFMAKPAHLVHSTRSPEASALNLVARFPVQ